MSRKRKTVQRSWESPAVSISNPGISDLFGFVPASSGVEVSRHSVYALPALLHGIDLIASTVGRIDCGVYKRGRDGTKSRDEEHPADYLLMRRPNDWQTPFEFRRELASDAVLGNAYAYVARDDGGRPTDLIILDPSKTWPVVIRYPDDVGRIQVYYVTEIQGRDITLNADDVLHVKGRVRMDTGLVGRSLLDVAKEILGLSIAVVKYGSYYFANSGLPSMIVEMPTFMKDKMQIEQFREGLDAAHRGLANSHKAMILQGGAKATRQQVNNEEAQFLESRMMTLTDVSLILGLPGSFLGSKQNTSYGSLEQDSLNLLVHTFSQWFTNLEQQFDRLLLTEVEKQRGIRWVEFSRQQLMESDHETTVNTWVTLVNNGLALPNDAAAALNLPPLDEEWNKPRLPSGVTLQGEEPEPPAPPPGQLPQQGQEGPPQAPQGDGADKGDGGAGLFRSVAVERCGGPGGTPGPCPKCEGGKCDDAAHAARQKQVTSVLQGKIDKAANLTPEQKAAYKDATAGLIKNMPPTALERFSGNVKKVAYHPDPKSLTEALASNDPQLQAEMKDAASRGKRLEIKGCYDRGEKRLDLDGGNAFEGKATAVGEFHAHEFAHAVDGPAHELSNSSEWKSAWASEMKGGSPSKYAGVKASEGFAEFGRLAYGQGKSADDLAKAYPQATAFFRSKGLL